MILYLDNYEIYVYNEKINDFLLEDYKLNVFFMSKRLNKDFNNINDTLNFFIKIIYGILKYSI